MRNIFVTADTHLFHENIIKYCNRPYDSIEEMNEVIIDNWNDTVNNNSTIYHLGDFMMGLNLRDADGSFDKMKKTVGRLRGNIHLISGNHDQILIKLCKFKNECPFHLIKAREYIRCQGKTITLDHRPSKIDYLLHGHSHGKVKSNGKIRVDVGVDCWDYAPIPMEVAISKLKVLEHEKHCR